MHQNSPNLRNGIRRFYNRFGAWEDRLEAYKNPAVEMLIAHGRFGDAHSVCEFACGSGRLARRLIDQRLPDDSTYLALDFSQTMVGLAKQRLASLADRAEVVLTDGTVAIPAASASFDRFLATYVFDLLDEHDRWLLLEEAHRVLEPPGLACVINLTFGNTGFSRLVSSLWLKTASRYPLILGGCRPLRFADYLVPNRWRVQHHSVVSWFGVASEVVVASKT